MRHLFRAAVVAALAGAGSAQEPALPAPDTVRAEGMPPIPLSLAEDVAPYGEFRSASLLAWHPLERRMLIATAFGNVPQIHEVRGPGAARTQLTFFRDGVGGGAWFEPRGRYFVFRKDTSGGKEAMQLFRFDPDRGAPMLLTDGRSRHGEPVWARSRGLIAYDSTRRDGRNRDLYLMDPSEPSSERMLARLEGSWRALDWSRDDRDLLAMEVVSSSGESYIWRVRVDTGERSALTARAGGQVLWTEARYSADGQSVYALGDRGGEFPRLWRLDLETRAPVPVTAEREAVEAFAESPDGRHLAVVYDREASSRLAVLEARTGRPVREPELPAGVISRLQWHPAGKELAFVFAGARTFSDVYSIRLDTDRVERWTTSEVGGASPAALPEAEIVRWTSFDGQAISGVIYRPPARFTGRRPVIVNIHGGPELRERPRALGRSNYFRNELGITLIYPNVRGSSGFGRTFESLDDGRKRTDAVKDIGALLDWIAAQPDLEASRVMLTGASYGGYLTLLAAAEYADRVRCAFEGFGMSDLPAFLETTDESRRADRNIEYGDPGDPAMREFLLTISPLTRAARLRIPLFIAQGARDTRVPLSQAEALVAALRRNSTPLWYVVYTDAGHLQLTATTNNFNMYAWVLFVRQFLLN